MRTSKPHVVIVGGVAAGTAAAAHLKRLEPRCRVSLIEKQPVISYSVCDIPYLTDGRAGTPQDLIVYTPERFSSEKGVQVYTNSVVTAIDIRRRQLTWKHTIFRTEETTHWDYLILATGVEPIQPFTGSNVFTTRQWDEAARLHQFLESQTVRNAVVIGAGLAGCEMAESLARRGIRAVLVEKDKDILSRMLPETHSRRLSGLLQKNGVQVISGTNDWSPVTEGNQITGIQIGKGDRVPADLVILAAGVKPPSGISGLENLRTDQDGYFLVDGKMKTSSDRIFAIGDGARVSGKSAWTRDRDLQLATRAAAMARKAAESIIGTDSPWKVPVFPVVLRLWDTETGSVGFLDEEDGLDCTMEISPFSRTDPRKGTMLLTLFFRKGSQLITGGAVSGPEGCMSALNLLSLAVNHQLTLQDLIHTGYAYHPMIAPRVNPLVMVASKAQKMIKRNR
ncbi:MAG: FAD-dependent oxidoreductase [Bacteroidetes bacterium]|nr:FAD-dependent oxidoreductase [Bacteroidota bacterium]